MSGQYKGYWNCFDNAGCCVNDNPGTDRKPKHSNLSIAFSGSNGFNFYVDDVLNGEAATKGQQLSSLPKCDAKECWATFGGGSREVNVNKYMTSAGEPTPALNKTFKELQTKGYSGVVFDYETDETNDKVSTTTIKQWTKLNEYFQGKDMKTALTMNSSGIGGLVKGSGIRYGLGSYTGGTSFLGKEVPFTYNMPQMYGGGPLFYNGDFDYSDLHVPDYEAGKNINALCSNLHPDTKLLPTFGGTTPEQKLSYPVGAVKPDVMRVDGTVVDWETTIKNSKCKTDAGYVSWNIPYPPSTNHSGCGDVCCTDQNAADKELISQGAPSNPTNPPV